jgi:hypothetical protein
MDGRRFRLRIVVSLGSHIKRHGLSGVRVPPECLNRTCKRKSIGRLFR